MATTSKETPEQIKPAWTFKPTAVSIEYDDPNEESIKVSIADDDCYDVSNDSGQIYLTKQDAINIATAINSLELGYK